MTDEAYLIKAERDYWDRRSGTDRRDPPKPREFDGTNKPVSLKQFLDDILWLKMPSDADVFINGIRLREHGIEYDPRTNSLELTVDFRPDDSGGNAA